MAYKNNLCFEMRSCTNAKAIVIINNARIKYPIFYLLMYFFMVSLSVLFIPKK